LGLLQETSRKIEGRQDTLMLAMLILLFFFILLLILILRMFSKQRMELEARAAGQAGQLPTRPRRFQA
jgi:hypothetical protein